MIVDKMEPEEAVVHQPNLPEKDDDATKAPRVLKTRVSFHQIEIREYARCLGDNPCTSSGPPLSIGWDYNVSGTYPVDKYEETRPPRRERLEMCVPSSVREDLLSKHSDVTEKEMKEAAQQVKLTRSRRIMSVATSELDDYRLLGEFITRRLRRWRTGVSKQREQELLWENAKEYMQTKSTRDSFSTEDTTDEFTVRTSGSSDATNMDEVDFLRG